MGKTTGSMYKKILTLLLILILQNGNTQSSAFLKIFDTGNNCNDVGTDMAVGNSGYLVACETACPGSTALAMGLGYYAFNGQLLWSKQFSGFRIGGFNCAISTLDGNFVIAGDVYLPAINDNAVFIMKITPQGDSLWTRYFNSPSTNFARSLNELPNGDLLIHGDGRLPDAAPEPEITLIKTNADGDLIWHKDYPENYRLVQYGQLIVLSTGEFLIIHGAWDNTSSFPRVGLTKLDNDGNVIWRKRYFKSRDFSNMCLQELPNGNYAFTAAVDSIIISEGLLKLAYITTDTNGVEQTWNLFYSSDRWAWVSDMKVGPQGQMLICGAIDNEQYNGYVSAWLARLDVIGNIEWQRSFLWDGHPPSAVFRTNTVRPLADGRIVLSGYVDDLTDSIYADATLMLVDSTGCFEQGCGFETQWATTPTRGIDDVFVTDVKIYPNPANEVVQVFYTGSNQSGSLQLFDLYGHSVYFEKIQAGQEHSAIRLDNLPAGIYVVVLSINGKKVMHKVVVI